MQAMDFYDQMGMERAFGAYFAAMERDYPDTMNAMLDARLHACDYQAHTLTLRAQARPWMTNPGGILHGGVTAAYLDLAMGLVCRYFSGGVMTPTLHIDVSYLRNGHLDETIYIQARATKLGSTICYAVGSVYPEGKPDRPIATAAGS